MARHFGHEALFGSRGDARPTEGGPPTVAIKNESKKATTRRAANRAEKKSANHTPRKNSHATASRKPASGTTALVERAADLLWNQNVTPHALLQELHEALLLRCLEEAQGNYAAAAALFGPSRQSVQQYANSPLRDGRWKKFQQNQRKRNDA